MWRIPIILNTLLMLLFGFCSAMSIFRAYNQFVQYAQSGSKPLPLITSFTLDNTWIYLAIPGVWIGTTLFLFWRYRGKTLPEYGVQIHTSSTLFVGLTMLALFLLGGLLPFIPIIVGLSK
jgi:hypothetical protein